MEEQGREGLLLPWVARETFLGGGKNLLALETLGTEHSRQNEERMQKSCGEPRAWAQEQTGRSSMGWNSRTPVRLTKDGVGDGGRAFKLGQGGMFVKNNGEPVEDWGQESYIFHLFSTTGSCCFWKTGYKGRGETKGFRGRCC